MHAASPSRTRGVLHFAGEQTSVGFSGYMKGALRWTATATRTRWRTRKRRSVWAVHERAEYQRRGGQPLTFQASAGASRR